MTIGKKSFKSKMQEFAMANQIVATTALAQRTLRKAFGRELQW